MLECTVILIIPGIKGLHVEQMREMFLF